MSRKKPGGYRARQWTLWGKESACYREETSIKPLESKTAWKAWGPIASVFQKKWPFVWGRARQAIGSAHRTSKHFCMGQSEAGCRDTQLGLWTTDGDIISLFIFVGTWNLKWSDWGHGACKYRAEGSQALQGRLMSLLLINCGLYVLQGRLVGGTTREWGKQDTQKGAEKRNLSVGGTPEDNSDDRASQHARGTQPWILLEQSWWGSSLDEGEFNSDRLSHEDHDGLMRLLVQKQMNKMLLLCLGWKRGQDCVRKGESLLYF